MNNRRKLIVAIGASALTTPLAAFAQQQGKVWRIGYLALPNRPADLASHYLGALAQGMRELGYVEGKNFVIEWRFADNDVKRMPGLAAELVQLKVDVIVTASNDGALALQKATATIPIVIINAGDPVARGLVKSLARPGGNITGVSTLNVDLGPKRLEMLHGMAPKVSRVAALVNPSNQGMIQALESLHAAGLKLGLKILPVEAQTPQEIDHAFARMREQKAGALIVILNPLFQQQKNQIAELAIKHRLPSMTADRVYPEAGCLMSYGSNLADSIRRTAVYVDKIFKGAKPADMPVEQPTRFELIINGKTAKALGLKIPNTLLVTAEKVIE